MDRARSRPKGTLESGGGEGVELANVGREDSKAVHRPFVQAFRSLREADALAVLADLNAFFTSERLPYYAVAEPSKEERERSSRRASK